MGRKLFTSLSASRWVYVHPLAVLRTSHSFFVPKNPKVPGDGLSRDSCRQGSAGGTDHGR